MIFLQILKAIIYLLDIVTLKRNRICFYITPRTNWDPNQQAIYSQLYNDFECVVSDGNNFSRSHPLASMLTYWKIIRSKVIVFDHSVPIGLSKRGHTFINVWHGSPIKRIRFLIPSRFSLPSLNYQASHTDLVYASSHYDAVIMAASLNVPYYNICSKGLPRLLYLEAKLDVLKRSDIYNEYEYVANLIHPYKKVILWAPTYRGNSSDINDPINLSLNEIHELESWLDKNDCLLLVRHHKFSTFFNNNDISAVERIVSCSELNNVNILLRFVDVLITDYSSIWVDFIYLYRPVVIYAPDLEQYNSEHGFVFDFEGSVPVDVLTSFKSVLIELDRVLECDCALPNDKYIKTRSLYHPERFVIEDVLSPIKILLNES